MSTFRLWDASRRAALLVAVAKRETDPHQRERQFHRKRERALGAAFPS
jgi:hypothetical protein